MPFWATAASLVAWALVREALVTTQPMTVFSPAGLPLKMSRWRWLWARSQASVSAKPSEFDASVLMVTRRLSKPPRVLATAFWATKLLLDGRKTTALAEPTTFFSVLAVMSQYSSSKLS